MSGSGSSGGFGSGGFGGKSIDCRSFSFESYINSPIQNEVDKLEIGDVLSVKLDTMGSVEVVKILNGNNLVGGIVDNGPTLKQCLENGFEYQAVVRSISGAAVKIFVMSIEGGSH